MNLKEMADLYWSKIFPAGSKAPIPKEAFIRMAYAEFSYFSWLAYLNEKNQEGYAEVPSYLTTEIELDVVNNVMDISGLKTLKSLPQDVWLQQIGGICECSYVKSTTNLTQLMCEDDSLPDTTKTYLIQGKKIKFPKGVHKSPLPITYANTGEDLNGSIEVDEAIASLIGRRLDEIYLGKVPPTDTTNQLNPNN